MLTPWSKPRSASATGRRLTSPTCLTDGHSRRRRLALNPKVLTSDLLRKAVAQLRSTLRKATSRKRQALVAASAVSGVPSSVSGGRRCRIMHKLKLKTPPKISAAARAAIELSYCQKDFLRNEITLWLADHSDDGTDEVDWNCITIKDVLEWSPDQCTELEPLHVAQCRIVEGVPVFGPGQRNQFITSAAGRVVFCTESCSGPAAHPSQK